MNRKGRLFLKEENYGKALGVLSEAVKLDPRNAQAHNARGYAYMMLGDPARAVLDFDAAIEIDPHYANAIRNRDTARRKSRDLRRSPEEASIRTVNAVRTEPSPAVRHTAPEPAGTVSKPPAGAEALHQRGRALLQAGKRAEAIEFLSQSLALNPRNAPALNARGYARFLQKDYRAALSDLDAAIKLNPSYANAYRNRAAVRKALGDAAGSASDLEKEKRLAR